MVDHLLIGIFFSSIISLCSYFARFLTPGGSIAQFVLGTVLLGLGGWRWTVPMLVFFFLSSTISKIVKRTRPEAELYFENSSRRDAWQVAANGGVAGLATVLWFFTHNELLYIAHLGAIAAATADTWGTEIGALSRSSPLLISTFRKVESGRSGAVSLLGFLAGILGSMVIFMASLEWVQASDRSMVFAAVLAGGILGSAVDSYMGARFQVQYYCNTCGKFVELREHCGSVSSFKSGYRWIHNDSVNFACTCSGALIAAGIVLLHL